MNGLKYTTHSYEHVAMYMARRRSGRGLDLGVDCFVRSTADGYRVEYGPGNLVTLTRDGDVFVGPLNETPSRKHVNRLNALLRTEQFSVRRGSLVRQGPHGEEFLSDPHGRLYVALGGD